MPVGLQLTAPRLKESLILKTAKVIEDISKK
jgi:Asp-tRNA(Asn)/Glu-tRNA(Gln) amidotransferase A subunit family amidase